MAKIDVAGVYKQNLILHLWSSKSASLEINWLFSGIFNIVGRITFDLLGIQPVSILYTLAMFWITVWVRQAFLWVEQCNLLVSCSGLRELLILTQSFEVELPTRWGLALNITHIRGQSNCSAALPRLRLCPLTYVQVILSLRECCEGPSATVARWRWFDQVLPRMALSHRQAGVVRKLGYWVMIYFVFSRVCIRRPSVSIYKSLYGWASLI